MELKKKKKTNTVQSVQMKDNFYICDLSIIFSLIFFLDSILTFLPLPLRAARTYADGLSESQENGQGTRKGFWGHTFLTLHLRNVDLPTFL